MNDHPPECRWCGAPLWSGDECDSCWLDVDAEQEASAQVRRDLEDCDRFGDTLEEAEL